MGPLKPYPPFHPKEQEKDAFIMIQSKQQLLYNELTCFHTKLNLRDASLGVGVSLNRLPRTGEIRLVNPTLDLLSMRAFVKHKVRHSLANDKFTHWLPLYFGENDTYEIKNRVIKVVDGEEKEVEEVTVVKQKERCIHLLKKAMLFMSAKSTRKDFNEEMVLEVMPKLMITHVSNLIKEFTHISIVAIRRLINFIRLFHLCIELYPEIGKKIDEKIEEFLADPNKRHKDHCTSLGDFLSYITISKKYKFADIQEAYLGEQMDRQAFWIL